MLQESELTPNTKATPTKDSVGHDYLKEGSIDPVGESLNTIMPSWPLQSLVAVNPFWFNRHRDISQVFCELSGALGQHLLMPAKYYRERFEQGSISQAALDVALNRLKTQFPSLPEGVAEFLSEVDKEDGLVTSTPTAAEAIPHMTCGDQDLRDDLAKYCAAFFDDAQALIRYPWQSGSFWLGWFEAQNFDMTMPMLGLEGFQQIVGRFRNSNPGECIDAILKELGLVDPEIQYLYCQKLLTSMVGWASKFQYLAWQKSLGYRVVKKSDLREFLAVRMIYDFAYFKCVADLNKVAAASWLKDLCGLARSRRTISHELARLFVWQLADEMTLQTVTAQSFCRVEAVGATPNIQMVFCIDVRSEALRRHIEAVSDEIQTIGFAGFFGAAVDYKPLDEKSFSHRLPGLIAPTTRLIEVGSAQDKNQNQAVPALTLIQGFFRNLRKAAIGSFLYVELFGIFTLPILLYRTFKSAIRLLRGPDLRKRFATQGHGLNVVSGGGLHGVAAIDQAEQILTSLGLRRRCARLVLICGHGAVTTNNALASALDCGACGGHAGDINARYVAKLLNSGDVRSGLRERGVVIPQDTHFIAAVHETVSDSVFILDEDKVPKEYRQELAELKVQLRLASRGTVKERQQALSRRLDKRPSRRAKSWSEVRPEWGLAGNAHFIIAPRARTKGVNLASRAFLHDYDWRSDQDAKILEQIMTAPMVVTNWINLQYYASVVAPNHFGSGNKVLHNITGERGVVEGNGGDLRIGLSHQSVHDGESFVHQPLRLSVYIEAPRDSIEQIIARHAVVRDLIENGWLHLLVIDSATSEVFRRGCSGGYERIT